MESLTEKRTRHFYRWEGRGRGRAFYPEPVSLEPPFVPFRFEREAASFPDDGRHPTALSTLFERLFGRRKIAPSAIVEEEEPEPRPALNHPRAEAQVFPPKDQALSLAAVQAWLQSLTTLQAPFSFELVGSKDRVSLLLSSGADELSLVSSALRSFFPGTIVRNAPNRLLDLWEHAGEGVFSVVEFGLRREFMIPLMEAKTFSPDPLTGVVAALQEVGEGELAVVQVLLSGVRAPWKESILRSVRTPSGEPFFADAPDVTAKAGEKVASPLFAVAVRIAACSEEKERLWALLRGIAGALSSATRGGNELVPLGDGELEASLEDLLLRTTHRPGALLSLAELSTFVHLPAGALPGVVRETIRTKRLPPEGEGEGILLGENRHEGEKRGARLPLDLRTRHLHVVGASGTGKSTLLVSLILEDVKMGRGVGVIDPHGDLVADVLARMPPGREEEVILFDPSDPEYVVGLNLLSTSSIAEKEMLASDLVAVFRRLSTSWGDQMTAVLSNAILAILESREGGTLLDLRRFLADQEFRKGFLQTVDDPHLREFWTREFLLLSSGKSLGPILARLDTLLRSRLVREVVSLREKALDFRSLVDQGQIFLGKLSSGAIGEENAALLGSLLVSKFHQASLLRQDIDPGKRTPFFLYLDEFHHLATPSMASLFSGARKFGLGVTVAHQDLYQLHVRVPEVERSVLANAYTRILFRLGEEDARKLSDGLSYFSADDLSNLSTGEAICRLGRRESDFNLSTLPLPDLNIEDARERSRELGRRSLERCGVPRQRELREKPAKLREAAVTYEVEKPQIEEVRAPEEEKRVERPSLPPRLPGKGGEEHTYLQELIRRWAMEHGFRAVVEEAIKGTGESVDVALYRGERKIACEVSVTTPSSYEAGNVEKCLRAGFDSVAVVSLKRGRLESIEKILAAKLRAEDRTRVHLFTPEGFLTFLSGEPAAEESGVVEGYKVKVRYQSSPSKSKRVAEILARSMKSLKKGEES